MKARISRNRKEDVMGTLAGDRPAWGEDWGYDRPGRHNYGDIAGVAPSTGKSAEHRDESTDSPDDLSGLLVCTVFWLLLIVSAVSWLAGK